MWIRFGNRKADPRPPNSGRKKGSKNKYPTMKLHKALLKHGCNFYSALAAAVKAENIEMIKALAGLVPYLEPKATFEAESGQASSEQRAPSPKTAGDRLALIRSTATRHSED